MTVGSLVEELKNIDPDMEIMVDAVDLDVNKLMNVVFVYSDNFYDEAGDVKKAVCLEIEAGNYEKNR